MKLRLVSACVLLAFASIACSDPQVEVTVRYYDIRGDQANQLRREISRKGPRGYDAYASWYVRWHFDHERSENSCAVTRASTEVDVEITLPRWVDEAQADEALRDRWARYYTALVDHENGHRDYGIRAAREIEEAIAALEPETSCERLTQTVNRTGKRILSKIVAEERAYDRDTNHGMNDGAVFP